MFSSALCMFSGYVFDRCAFALEDKRVRKIQMTANVNNTARAVIRFHHIFIAS